MGASLNTRHDPRNCGKKQLSINLIESLESDDENGTLASENDYDGGESPQISLLNLPNSLQNTKHESASEESSSCSTMETNLCANSKNINNAQLTNNDLSDKIHLGDHLS